MGREKLLFIFNPKSGQGLIKKKMVDILDIMTKAGYDVTAYPTQEAKDATRKIEAVGRDYDRIVCCGGDGTLDEVVEGMCRAKIEVPLGYIPAGSTNDFATSLNISSDMKKAAQIAVGNTLKSIDIGVFNEDNFVYIAAFGIFTEISYQTPQELKNQLGHLAYILSAVKSLADIPSYLVQVEVDGQIIQDKFIYGMITNSVSVGGFKGMTGKDVQLDDGKFEVTLIKSPSNIMELNEILGSLSSLIDDTDLVYTFKTNHLRIQSKEEIAWTRDGEFGGRHKEVEICNLQKKIEMLIKDEK